MAKRKTNKTLKTRVRRSGSKKTSPKHPIFRFLSSAKFYFILGTFLILISVVYHVYEITKYSFTATPTVDTAQQVQRKPLPMHIDIDQTTMDFPVVETVIQHGVWQVADNGVSHLGISARPGEDGAIIMYAHNLLDRFGSLPYVYIGQKVTITTADNKKYVYIIKKTQVVSPTDTKILTNQKGEVLILYTCYGFADLERFVVLAYPQH